MKDKRALNHRQRLRKGLPLLGVCVGLVACSSPQPRLYLLSDAAVQPSRRAEVSGVADQTRRDVSATLTGMRAGLSVSLPQYLDRPDMLVRSSGNELTALPDSRWAEDLSITASRVMADDLDAALPGADIVAWPTRVEKSINFRIAVDLTKFESDVLGNVVIEGRWSLLDDRSDAARAGGHFRYTKASPSVDAKAMAQTMSDLLAMTSGQIAAELQTLHFASVR